MNVTLLNTTSFEVTGATRQAAEAYHCTVFRFALYSVFMSIMCLVGFIFNALSLGVLHGDKHTPLASFLLRCLAIADNCYIVAWVIQYPVSDIRRFFSIRITQRHNIFIWYNFLVYTYPTLYVAQMAMIWLTVLIALNRYVAVCLPYRSNQLCSVMNVRLSVIAVIAFSVLYNVPRFCERYVTLSDSGAKMEDTVLASSELYKKVYVDILYYVSSFFLPLAILAFCNTFVIVKYRLMLRRRCKLVTSSRKRDASKDYENNVTVVMIMVVLVFMMCQSPARLVQIIWSYSYDHCYQFQYYLIHISNTLEVLNSSLNFVVYCMFHRQFRTTLRRHLCCWRLSSSSNEASIDGGRGEGSSRRGAREGASHRSVRGAECLTTAVNYREAGNTVSTTCVTLVPPSGASEQQAYRTTKNTSSSCCTNDKVIDANPLITVKDGLIFSASAV